MASLDQAAAHCFISSQRFRELLARGAITKAERGRYDLDRVREQFIRHLSKMAAGRNDSGGVLAEARARQAVARAEREERSNVVERGEVANLALIVQYLKNEFLTLRARMLNLPGELAYAVADRPQDEVYHVLDDKIREVLEWIADPDHAAKQAAAAGIKSNNAEPDWIDDDEDKNNVPRATWE
jgi:hypothetical protein